MQIVIDNPARTRIGGTPSPQAAEDRRLQEACQAFEAIFINQLLTSMRQSVATDGLIPRGSAEQIYQGMLDQEYADEFARGQTMGLGRSMYDQLRQELAGTTVGQPMDAVSRRLSALG
jgi:flagellar protein FlgJ